MVLLYDLASSTSSDCSLGAGPCQCEGSIVHLQLKAWQFYVDTAGIVQIIVGGDLILWGMFTLLSPHTGTAPTHWGLVPRPHPLVPVRW